MAARLSFACSAELDERLRARAAAEERSVSWCIVRALEEWLGGLEPGKRADGAPVSSAPAAAAAKRSATPRAPEPPPFARVTSLGGPPRPVPRRAK